MIIVTNFLCPPKYGTKIFACVKFEIFHYLFPNVFCIKFGLSDTSDKSREVFTVSLCVHYTIHSQGHL